MVTKQCVKCHKVKPLSQYHRRSISPLVYRERCADCTNIQRRQHYIDHPEYYKKYKETDGWFNFIRYRYNLSKADYLSLYEKCKGSCAICGKKPEKKNELHVDHDHTTGKIRGLLWFLTPDSTAPFALLI